MSAFPPEPPVRVREARREDAPFPTASLSGAVREALAGRPGAGA